MTGGLNPEDLEAQQADVLEDRESMMVLSPGTGGAFAGVATAADVAAEPSPMDDTATIQGETA